MNMEELDLELTSEELAQLEERNIYNPIENERGDCDDEQWVYRNNCAYRTEVR